MFSELKKSIENRVQTFCKQQGIPLPAPLDWKPIPFSGEWGISIPIFPIAAMEIKINKTVHTSVPIRAQQIAEQIVSYLGKSQGFSRIVAVKGYLNCYFSTAEYCQHVIDTILTSCERFGAGSPSGKQVMVEFSQPNTHKAFHVGHLRSAILGDVISRILAFSGFEVIRANYLGDIGYHVIKWLWNYQKYHPGEEPSIDITKWMGDLYAEASHRLEENPELETEVRDVYRRWDKQEPEIVHLWKTTRQWSLDGFDAIYRELDIHFDRLYSNSEVEKPGKQMVDELISKGVAVDERPEGPVFVEIDKLLGLKQEKYRVFVILRSDGTALYATEDLALALMKFREYKLDRSIYVVDVRQSLHFQQLFKTLEIAGYQVAEKCEHLAYELVNLPGNVVMASREGTVVLLEDLIREAKQRAYQVVQEKNPALAPKTMASVASSVGVGALKYPMLARENTKIVTFDWDAALDFNGQAAPYIQYAHVRANSILEKMGDVLPSSHLPDYELESPEVELVDWVSRFPDIVRRSAEELKPLHLTTATYEIARAFNYFYNQCQVLKADPEIRQTRLRLVAATRQVLANALDLLGIQAPQVM